MTTKTKQANEVEGLTEIDDALAATMTIHQRMVAILAELPAIGKTQRNEQQKFMYRGHDDVLNALNPLLAKWGVIVVPNVIERVTDARTTKSGSTMYEVNLHVRYRFYGTAGDFVEASAWGEGTDSGDKSTNKAMTMAFKNVLAQAFAVSTAELSDADATSPEPTTRGAAPAQQSRPAAAPTSSGPPLPRSWAALEEAVEGYGTGEWQVFRSFVEEMSEHMFKQTELAELTKDQRDIIWQKALGAYAALSDANAPGAFPPPTRSDYQRAFATRLDGHVLEGPPYAMSPDETDKPSRDAVNAPGGDLPAEEETRD